MALACGPPRGCRLAHRTWRCGIRDLTPALRRAHARPRRRLLSLGRAAGPSTGLPGLHPDGAPPARGPHAARPTPGHCHRRRRHFRVCRGARQRSDDHGDPGRVDRQHVVRTRHHQRTHVRDRRGECAGSGHDDHLTRDPQDTAGPRRAGHGFRDALR